jgi:stringent starvation protein B
MEHENPEVEAFRKAYLESTLSGKEVYLSFDSNDDDLVIPEHLKKTGDVTLNVSKNAIRDIEFTPKYLEFRTCFNQIPEIVSLPYSSIIALIEADDSEDKDE